MPELKIILTDDIKSTKIYLDNEQIGLIQNIKINCDVENLSPLIEMSIINRPEFNPMLSKHIDILKQMFHVKLHLIDLNKE